jgi:hypothetical protein
VLSLILFYEVLVLCALTHSVPNMAVAHIRAYAEPAPNTAIAKLGLCFR